LAAHSWPLSLLESRTDQSVLVGVHDRLDSIAKAEFGEHGAEVGLHGGLGQMELGGEFGGRFGARCVGDEPLDQAAGDCGGEQDVAVGGCADRGEQLVAGRGLQRESGGAGAHRLVHVLVEVEGREHEHAGPVAAGELPGRLDAIQARVSVRP
jgi:hypothetical protein